MVGGSLVDVTVVLLSCNSEFGSRIICKKPTKAYLRAGMSVYTEVFVFFLIRYFVSISKLIVLNNGTCEHVVIPVWKPSFSLSEHINRADAGR